MSINESAYKCVNGTQERLHGSDMAMLKKQDVGGGGLDRELAKKNHSKADPSGGGYDQINSQGTPYSKDQQYQEFELMKQQYQTPDALMQKQYGMDKHVEDMEMGLKQRKAFTRDDFMMMITDTYNEFYGKFRDQFNPDEYMQCVDDEELVKRLSAFLEYSDDNILTTQSMPWLDLGSIPSTHSFMRTESQQVYYVPNNRNPDLVYVRYSQMFPKYYSRNPKKRFDGSNLKHREVTYRDFEQTLNLCSMLMKNYRGKILLYDWIGYSVIVLGLIIIILLGVATSSQSNKSGESTGNWGNMVLYILLYFIFVPIIYKVSKCFQCKYLRQAHFVLAVVCRAENNRYYLKRGVEVRPGYLARWVEFSVIDTSKGGDTATVALDLIQKRHAYDAKETQKNIEADHQKFMDGVNRDFNQQAIELRIQIEEAKLGRELTDDEKNAIINS